MPTFHAPQCHWKRVREIELVAFARHGARDVGDQYFFGLCQGGYTRRFVDDSAKKIAFGLDDVAGVNADPKLEIRIRVCLCTRGLNFNRRS